MQYEVDLGIPARNVTGIALSQGDYDKAWKDSLLLEEELGLTSDSSGTGFGFRDMQFICPTETDAKSLCARIRKWLEDRGYTLGEEDGNAYCGICEWPETRAEALHLGWSESDIMDLFGE